MMETTSTDAPRAATLDSSFGAPSRDGFFGVPSRPPHARMLLRMVTL